MRVASTGGFSSMNTNPIRNNQTSGREVHRTTYHVPQMDCPSEEQMIRLKLEPLEDVLRVEVQISQRTVHVYHKGPAEPITESIIALGLGASWQDSKPADPNAEYDQRSHQKNLLWWVLVINAVFFLLEMSFGLLANSMGLIADSLDMLADSIVYGLSLLAVGTALKTKKKVAFLSGIFQMILAVLGFSEVVRRFFFVDTIPDFRVMITVSLLALAANIVCLFLIRKARSDEAHMRASAIFTSNDVIVNGGVIVAGILVCSLSSKWPDLLVGAIVFGFVIRGAVRILKLSK